MPSGENLAPLPLGKRSLDTADDDATGKAGKLSPGAVDDGKAIKVEAEAVGGDGEDLSSASLCSVNEDNVLGEKEEEED